MRSVAVAAGSLYLAFVLVSSSYIAVAGHSLMRLKAADMRAWDKVQRETNQSFAGPAPMKEPPHNE